MANKSDIKRKTVGDVCRYILFSTQTRKPIYKKELTAIVKKANIAKTQDIIDEAKKKLAAGFGFDFVEAPNRTSYFVVVKQDRSRNEQEEERQNQLRGRLLNYDQDLKKYRGLICVVLQLLILNGNKCEKDKFNHLLFDKLDTTPFGNQNEIIRDLKTQKWIEEEKEQNDERVYYTLGPRADIESMSEWQYIAAFELVNGMRPPDNDRALQRIANEKLHAQRQSNRNTRSRNTVPANFAQHSSQRGRARGRGRSRGRSRG
mmetsp:Transcript_65075/g.103593  ORF Transcript_65075/g.103593 Transcript_65075/m.103593 type:complete len:260 (-) Transcript_65075:180-959(-)